MNKRLVLFALAVVAVSAARAAFTPGRYEIQDLGGKPIGTLAVTTVKSSYNNQPATRVDWQFTYNAAPFKSKETHEAYITKEGLVYFRRHVKDDQGEIITMGGINGATLMVQTDNHGRKIATGAPRKDFKVSEYDMDLLGSPFAGMKLKEAKSVGVFSVREMGAVSARRNINKLEQFPKDGRFIPVLLISTTFPNSVTTSWFSANSHSLYKEVWSDRQFVRTGD